MISGQLLFLSISHENYVLYVLSYSLVSLANNRARDKMWVHIVNIFISVIQYLCSLSFFLHTMIMIVIRNEKLLIAK